MASHDLARPRARVAAPAGVVAIAASAGGVEAIGRVTAGLPADLPAAVLVLQHVAEGHRSHLVEILRRRTDLEVDEASDGATLRPGAVYVAPSSVHLLVAADRRLALSHAGRRHSVRPSADLLFRSLAAACGARAVAVVLSGSGRDGADELGAVKAAGGWVIAQDAGTARFFGMPSAAIASGYVDQVLPIEDVPAAVVEAVARLAPA